MTARKRAWWLAGVACLAMIPLHYSSALSADKGTAKGDGKPVAQAPGQAGKAAGGRLDRGKNDVIEPAVKNLVKQGVPAPAGDPVITVLPRDLDVGKYTIIEPAVRAVVTGSGGQSIQPRLDVGKSGIIEVGAKNVVKAANANPPQPPPAPKPRLDVGKRLVVEPAAKNLAGPGSVPVPPIATVQPVAGPTAPAAPKEFVNPKVDTGKIKWHATFEEACAASKKSGKPVMLFQMMGKLDDQFC